MSDDYIPDFSFFEYELSITVEDRTCCMGSHVPRNRVGLSKSFLGGLGIDWLTIFLTHTNPESLIVHSSDHAPEGMHRKLIGDYVIHVKLNDVPFKEGKIPVVVTCADGQHVSSDTRYNPMRVGDGLFRGYRLRYKDPWLNRYNITYLTKLYANNFEELELLERPSNRIEGREFGTVVASHFYMVDNELVEPEMDLSRIEPLQTRVNIHYLHRANILE
jgi:hypothetical protein